MSHRFALPLMIYYAAHIEIYAAPVWAFERIYKSTLDS